MNFLWLTAQISQIILALFTICVALLLHYYYTKRTVTGAETLLTKDRRKHESRLLNEKFGNISDDLVLNETVESTDDENYKNSTIETSEPRKSATEKEAIIAEPHKKAAKSDSIAAVPHKVSDLKSAMTGENCQAVVDIDKLAVANDTDEFVAARPTLKFSRESDEHPGLEHFCHWFDVDASLFRIYTVTRRDGAQDDSTIAPYNPSSKRGHVAIELKVENMLAQTVNVYWIDFKGSHVHKGTIAPGGNWRQTTWIDHPWIFCENSDEKAILLHYIPYRVIPTTAEAPTMEPSGSAGVHRFQIKPPGDMSTRSCTVTDPIFPYPSVEFFQSPRVALEMALLHCVRMDYIGWNILLTYLRKALKNPHIPKYRQIRTANRTFHDNIWNTPARGVFLAIGFVENGAYVELGSVEPLTYNAIQVLSTATELVESWYERSQRPHDSAQPEGADGSGRAGFTSR